MLSGVLETFIGHRAAAICVPLDFSYGEMLRTVVTPTIHEQLTYLGKASIRDMRERVTNNRRYTAKLD